MTPTSKTISTFDELFKLIRSYGRYQLFFLVVIQYLCLPQAAHFVVNFFSLGGLVPSYICNDGELKFNYSSKFVKTNSAFVCEQITKCTNLTTENAWRSIYEEYTLVCRADHIRSTLASMRPLGVIIGYLTAGYLTDRFGRKWIMVCGVLLEILFGFAQATLTPTWEYFVVFIILDAVISPFTLFTGAAYSLIMESVNSKYRLVQGCAFQFCLGYIFAGCLAYLSQDWRLHIIIANIIAIPGLIMTLFIQESPRFLAQRGEFDKAAKVMTKISKINGRKKIFTETEIKATQLDADERPKTKYTPWTLFKSRKLAMYSVSQITTGIGMNIVGSIILFNIQDLSGNPLFNASLLGAVRLWTPFFAVFLENGVKNFGRKTLMVGSQVRGNWILNLGMVCACFSVMLLISSLDLWTEYHKLMTAIALFGYATELGLVWFAYKLYTTELYPTVIRTTALNVFSTTSLIGSVLSPQLVHLTKYWHAAPYCGAAIVTLLATVFSIVFLPETKGVPLPDTLIEAEAAGRYLKKNGVHKSPLNAEGQVELLGNKEDSQRL